jgi:hypothetical protein
MQEFPINWFAILAAVIIKQAIGAFWYSPALFGPSWCKLAGVSEAEMKAALAKALIPDVIGSALMAFVLVHAVHYAGANSWAQGAAVGFFQCEKQITIVDQVEIERPLFEGDRAERCHGDKAKLVVLLMGAVLAVWP